MNSPTWPSLQEANIMSTQQNKKPKICQPGQQTQTLQLKILIYKQFKPLLRNKIAAQTKSAKIAISNAKDIATKSHYLPLKQTALHQVRT